MVAQQIKEEAISPDPGGMPDRSRMLLCGFLFLCLAINPFAWLMGAPGSPHDSARAHGTARTILGLPGELDYIHTKNAIASFGILFSRGNGGLKGNVLTVRKPVHGWTKSSRSEGTGK